MDQISRIKKKRNRKPTELQKAAKFIGCSVRSARYSFKRIAEIDQFCIPEVADAIRDGTLTIRTAMKLTRFDHESQRYFLSIPRDQLGSALWAELQFPREADLLETISRLERQLQNAYAKLEQLRETQQEGIAR